MSGIARKFLFVSGKGGVGKTTVAVALARALAAQGRRVLLCHTEPNALQRDLFAAPVEPAISNVQPNLDAVLLEPQTALSEYGGLVLGSKTAQRALFDNRVSRSFFAAIPGLHQWAVLGKAWYHASVGEASAGGYETVVFDAPATGHGLQMLSVPLAITQTGAPGRLKRDADAAWSFFQDPKSTGIVLVSLGEELPVTECLELREKIQSLGLPVAVTVANSLLEPLFSSKDEVNFQQLSTDTDPAAQELLWLAEERRQVEQRQARAVQALSESVQPGETFVELPRVDAAESMPGIKQLANIFMGSAPREVTS